jgi:Outer membrane protein beta-barrel domain
MTGGIVKIRFLISVNAMQLYINPEFFKLICSVNEEQSIKETSLRKIYMTVERSVTLSKLKTQNKIWELFIKRLISFILFMSIVHLTAPRACAQVLIGIQGGLSVPDLSGGNNEVSQGYTSRLAPNFGLTFEFTMTDNISIEPQINFNGQGGQRNVFQPIASLPPPYEYANFNNMSILNYIEMPVLAKYIYRLNGIALDINGGPFIGFLSW